MKKILVVLTNISRYKDTNEATGLWLGEATEFIEDVTNSGYEVDYVSPKGGFVPLDPRSMGSRYTNKSSMEIYESNDFKNRALMNSLKPSDISPENYDAIYFTGGHGVMWDFSSNQELQAISLAIYKNGGYITSVCHGIAGLLNIKIETGEYLISNKKITGFTTAEEVIAGKKSIVPFLNEEVAKQHGADFQKKRAYKEYAIEDGQLITGQNPFSAHAVAKLLIQNLKNRQEN